MYLNLVREIKAAITNSETLPDEFIVELAAEYRQACDEVNRRLIQVTALLQMGLRDEAVQVADYPRSLLDSVRELNFKQRQDWVSVLADKKLEVPPRLEFPAAVRLEQAYQKLSALNPLLKKNRLLALAQAPLQSRIVMLGKLIENDPENPVWKLDLAALQEARLAEVRDDLRKATKLGDGDQIGLIVAELQGDWSVEVPPALMAQAHQSLNAIGMKSHLQNMETVADALQQSWKQSDEQAAFGLREKWFQLNKSANLQDSDPLAKKAAQPLAWLDGLDQQRVADRNYAQSKVDLEHALDAKLPLQELDRRVARVTKFGRDDASDLLTQSTTYRKTLISQQQQQSQILKYGLIGLGVAALAAAGWFGLSQYRQGQIAQSRTVLAKFVGDGDLDAGKRYHQQLPSFAKTDSEITQLHARMAGLEKKESQRVAMFQEVVGRINFEGELGQELDDLIQRAAQYAKDDAENERLVDLRNELETTRKQRQQQRTTRYLADAKPLEEKLASMLVKVKSATAMPEALSGVADRLNELKKEALRPTDGLAGITLAAKQRTESLVDEANSVIQKARQKNQSAQALTMLKDQAVKLRSLDDALTRFEKLYPENPNARDFRSSVQERNLWEGFRQWRDLATTVRNYDLEKLDLPELKRFNADMLAASELTRFTNWPQSLQRTKRFVDGMVSDHSDLLRRLGESQAFFKQRNHTQIHVLQRDGLRYYLTHEFAPRDRKFFYFQRGQSQSEGVYQDDDIGGLAGHCDLAKEILVAFDSFSGDADRALLGLLKTSLRKSKELTLVNGPTIDPLVQADFIDRILMLIEQVSPDLKSYAERQREILRRFQVAGLMWRNVIDDDANAARGKAQQAIDAIRLSVPAAEDQLANDRESMKKWSQLADFAPAGILYRKGQQWIADVAIGVGEGSALYCIFPGRRNTASIDKVGVYRQGVVDQGNSALPLQAGRPLFILAKQQK